MAEEQIPGEEIIEGQTPEPSDEERRIESRAEQRIQELARRNQELEKLVNMSQRLDQVETNQQMQQQAQVQQQRAADPEVEQWTPWIRPKMMPVLQEILQPYQQAFMNLVDKQDFLETIIEYPEYKDPEVQQQVEQVRKMRLQQTGQLESRKAVIIYLRGQNVDKIAEERAKKLLENKERGEEGSFIESGVGVGTSRAAKGMGRSFADLPVEEQDKFLADNMDKVRF